MNRKVFVLSILLSFLLYLVFQTMRGWGEPLITSPLMIPYFLACMIGGMVVQLKWGD